MQPGFFDLNNRYSKLDERDPLVRLNSIIHWEQFRYTLEKIRPKDRKNNAGRKPYDAVLMFKAMIIQHSHNISDDQLEYQIRDRYSFSRFLGLPPEDAVPDSKTLWLFRENLIKANVMRELFNGFDLQLQEHGVTAQKGQIVDATFVVVPRQRNSREENKHIKAGEIPDRINESDTIKRQKDLDTRWTKKNDETHFGYKNHVSIDAKNKIIRDYDITDASVQDSQVFTELLSESDSSDVWADSAYRSEALEKSLKEEEYRSQVHEKARRNHPLTQTQKASNTKKSKIRSRVEHVFGSITHEQGGIYFRTIGISRAQIKIGLMNLTYNMRRL